MRRKQRIILLAQVERLLALSLWDQEFVRSYTKLNVPNYRIRRLCNLANRYSIHTMFSIPKFRKIFLLRNRLNLRAFSLSLPRINFKLDGRLSTRAQLLYQHFRISSESIQREMSEKGVTYRQRLIWTKDNSRESYTGYNYTYWLVGICLFMVMIYGFVFLFIFKKL